jgi:hypothetical protein
MRSSNLLPRLAPIALVAFAPTTTVFSQERDDSDQYPVAEIALSDETVQLRYVDTSDFLDVEDSRLSGAFFLSEDRDVVLSAGAQFPTDLELGPLSFTFGPQVYAALLDEENSDIIALSLGVEMRLDVIPSLGVAVAGQAHYAPDVLTFGSADNIVDLSARLEVGLADRLILFGGIRLFEFDLIEGEGERTLQDELFAGFGYRF